MHDKYLYEVKYPYGMTEQLAANIIAENMLSQVDSEGHHKRDDSAISKVDGFIKSRSGELQQKRTICGWKLLVEPNQLIRPSIPLIVSIHKSSSSVVIPHFLT